MAAFNVFIYTPTKVAAKGIPADSVIIPTHKGQIQVLPGHTHLVTKLGIGALVISYQGKEQTFLINEGTCQILGNKILLLAQGCENPSDMSKEKSLEQVKKLQEQMASMNGYDPLFPQVEKRLKFAELRLKTGA